MALVIHYNWIVPTAAVVVAASSSCSSKFRNVMEREWISVFPVAGWRIQCLDVVSLEDVAAGAVVVVVAAEN